MRRPLPEVHESEEELRSLLKRTRDPRRRRRIHLLLLIRTGQARSRQAAAAHLAVHRNSVREWLEKYREGGLKGLLQIGTPGARPGQKVLPPAVLRALVARLEGEGFESYGQVREWLEREFGLDLPYATVYGLVRVRLGGRLKRPRPRHAKKKSRAPASPGG